MKNTKCIKNGGFLNGIILIKYIIYISYIHINLNYDLVDYKVVNLIIIIISNLFNYGCEKLNLLTDDVSCRYVAVSFTVDKMLYC